MINTIIFDWDMTIVDSLAKITQVKQLLAKKYQLSLPTLQQVKAVLGQPFREEALVSCFPEASSTLLDLLAADFHRLMQHDEHQAPLFKYARYVLTLLKENNFKLAIATSKSRSELTSALQYHQLQDLFEVSCCGDEFQNQGKPNPAMLLHIMQALNINANNCCYVGDAKVDIEMAKKANITMIAINTGVYDDQSLAALHPDYIVNDWQALLQQVNELCAHQQFSY